MKTKDVIAHFGSQAELARVLGIKPPSISGWGEDVPALRQLQIQSLTLGKLRAASDVFDKKPAEHKNN